MSNFHITCPDCHQNVKVDPKSLETVPAEDTEEVRQLIFNCPTDGKTVKGEYDFGSVYGKKLLDIISASHEMQPDLYESLVELQSLDASQIMPKLEEDMQRGSGPTEPTTKQ